MAKSYKILVPKPASADKFGSSTKLYVADEIVEANESWQDEVMQAFVENGWAMEVKAETGSEELGEPVRARNEKGHYIADDPDTPDVNEAYEGGKSPKKTTKKRKTTKKKS